MTSSPIQFDTKSPDETDRLAATLAPLLRPGDVIALAGNLGAGKTHFTRALASALGNSPDSVSSPTFVLLHQYLDGHLPIYHFDTYRLGDLDEFLMLGADELMAGDGVTVIEWADRVTDALPENHIHIRIEHTGESARRFRMGLDEERATLLKKRLAVSG